LDIAQQAALNWKARSRRRAAKVAAIDKGDYTKAESKQRLALRVNRLIKATNAAAARSDVAAAKTQEALRAGLPGMGDVLRRGEFRPEDIDNCVVERVIGETRDFLMIGFLEKGVLASRAVCRIVTNLGAGSRSFGTGFLVTPSLLMTNNHVLPDAETAAKSTAEFNYQLSGTGALVPVETFELAPSLFYLTDRDFDFALVAVAQTSANGVPLSSFGYCPVIWGEGKVLVGDPVNIIQHPKGEPKQVVIRENKMLDLPEKETAPLDRFAHYEADTEPGSSGSPVFNDQWEVVALHHSGIPRTNAQGQTLDRKGNVWQPNGDPDQIDWVANEGIRASRLVAFIKDAPIPDTARALHDEFMKISNRNVVPQAVAPAGQNHEAQPNGAPALSAGSTGPRVLQSFAPTPKAPAASADIRPVLAAGADMRPVPAAGADARPGAVTLTLPLTISISLGGALAGVQTASIDSTALAMPAPVRSATSERRDGDVEAVKPDPDYAHRPGFDPKFLGFAAPLPTPTVAIKDLVVPVGGGIELKYFHYSVIMNSARKLAFVSAVNLDIGAKFQVKREGKDRWFYDERISHDVQAGPELYADNPLDCGHLTRRQDAAWGDSEQAARLANDDTFHWTNCSPQHEVFNQSSKSNHNGLLLWGNLEMYVTAQAKKDQKRLAVFNGPVFRKTDRVYRGIQLPREYWKLIVYTRDDGKPGAVAFVLSQDSLIKNLAAEEFVVGPYQPYQVKIGDLETRTNLDFGAFRTFDPLPKAARESLLEGAQTAVVPIATLGDVVF
jgi:endonuclease G, mitochondrial